MSSSTALLTDLYQLTMAAGYYQLGLQEREAVFYLHFRTHPFGGNYAVSCGLQNVIDCLQDWKFTDDDIAYLKTLNNDNGDALFKDDFLGYLKELTFGCDVDAVPEGSLIFAGEPFLRLQGPLLQCQMLETALLNIMNFQTLVATKASRIYQSANGEPVLEFGLRRAQGGDGGVSASRAAYIGGCVATSNVLAGKKYDIPVKGTHAHSWVMVFDDELTAFDKYAEVMPDNATMLVDTYDTISGVKNAIIIGKKLQSQGKKLQGIRLDSGDMAELSIAARKLLDDAGFSDTQIVASNNLDEYRITLLKEQGAKISVWGVGTHLATAYDQPALDGVYKLSALRDDQGEWEYKLKLSEDNEKISTPGIPQVRRYFDNDKIKNDIVYDVELGVSSEDAGDYYDLLVPVFRQGRLIKVNESIHDIRGRALQQVSDFVNCYKQEAYSVMLDEQLLGKKHQLIEEFLG